MKLHFLSIHVYIFYGFSYNILETNVFVCFLIAMLHNIVAYIVFGIYDNFRTLVALPLATIYIVVQLRERERERENKRISLRLVSKNRKNHRNVPSKLHEKRKKLGIINNFATWRNETTFLYQTANWC